MPVQYIKYKGKTIVYADYRNQDGAQAVATLAELIEVGRTLTEKGLLLSDYRNMHASPEFMSLLKKNAREVAGAIEHKSAVIGITGVKHILLTAYNSIAKKKVVMFDTEEEAKEWLIKD